MFEKRKLMKRHSLKLHLPLLTLPILAILALSGCQPPATKADTETAKEPAKPKRQLNTGPIVASNAEQFLKESMDRYAGLESFRAQIDRTFTLGDKPPEPGKKQVFFEAPNKFKVVTEVPGVTLTSVSDGAKLVEYTTSTEVAPQSYPAPEYFQAPEASLLSASILSGSLLHAFFAGADHYEELVNTLLGKVEFLDNTTLANSEKAKVVQFYAQGKYGTSRVWISEQTGLVHKIEFDAEPIVQELLQDPSINREFKLSEGKLNAKVVELISQVKTNEPIAVKEFDTTIPEKLMRVASGQPLLQAGDTAPDFTVTSLDGRKVSLKDLKGKIVLLDFWATWCGPCIEALPHTAEIAKEFGSDELVVLAISDEKKETVEEFLKEHKIDVPTFLDEGSKANQALAIQGLPTYVVIDAQGKVAKVSVGASTKAYLLKLLKEAGLDV
jgi:thiol-disulfide isomerase/thioredoxin/outer membrane lipoprotein-sorting protein